MTRPHDATPETPRLEHRLQICDASNIPPVFSKSRIRYKKTFAPGCASIAHPAMECLGIPTRRPLHTPDADSSTIPSPVMGGMMDNPVVNGSSRTPIDKPRLISQKHCQMSGKYRIMPPSGRLAGAIHPPLTLSRAGSSSAWGWHLPCRPPPVASLNFPGSRTPHR